MACGAVDAAASANFCLEGRCDSCVMEDVDGEGGPLRACQEIIPDDGRTSIRIRVGGDDADDTFWGEDWAWKDAAEEAGDEAADDLDDPFDAMRNGCDGSAWGVAAGDAQEWEQFEGSKYYRE